LKYSQFSAIFQQPPWQQGPYLCTFKLSFRSHNYSSVILKLDTPGGDVTSSDILYREIKRFKETTGLPVVGLMMGVAASGGYYVASACDRVIAHGSSLLGFWCDSYRWG
jgi:protease-4